MLQHNAAMQCNVSVVLADSSWFLWTAHVSVSTQRNTAGPTQGSSDSAANHQSKHLSLSHQPLALITSNAAWTSKALLYASVW